jgi:hypothetical protein
MIKLICFVKRKPGMGRDEFHDHWLNQHGPLIRDTPELARHLIRYEQNHKAPEIYGETPESEDVGHDGVTIQWFESMSAFGSFCTSEAYRELIAPDEARFLDRSAFGLIFSDAENVIIPRPDGSEKVGAKLLCLLTRNDAHTAESFADYWRDVHAPLFCDSPDLAEHILGYVQHRRAAQDYAREQGGGFDGMTEQWYRDPSAFYEIARSKSYREKIMPDEEKLLDRSALVWCVTRPSYLILG